MENQIAETAPVAPVAEAAPAAPSADATPAAPKKRGRPPGSKNKPKAAPAAVAEGAPAEGTPAAVEAEAEKRGGHLVTISNIKAVIKSLEANMGGDFIEALEDKVKDILVEAYNRCVANGRKTLRPCDL